MDKIQLKSFIAVVENNSITQAANHLFITQPAMSKRLKSLEEELGCLLFHREKRSLTLSESGKVFLPEAYKLLGEMDNCKTLIQNLNQNIEGTLNIASSHHIGIHHLPPLLKKYQSTFNKVEIHLSFLESEKAMQGLLSGKFECALITLPDYILPNFIHKTIWTDDLYITYSKQHALAKSKAKTINELINYSAILPSSKTYTRELIDNYFFNQKLKIEKVMESNYLETIKMMVDAGLGWSFLPDNLIEKDWVKLKLPIKFSRNLGIITQKTTILSNAATQFWQLTTNN